MFVPNSVDDGNKAVEALQSVWKFIDEKTAQKNGDSTFTTDCCMENDLVVMKISAPDELWAMVTSGMFPDDFKGLHGFKGLTDTDVEIDLGHCFEDLIASPDKPLSQHFGGAKVTVKGGFLAAGKQFLKHFFLRAFWDSFDKRIRLPLAQAAIDAFAGIRINALAGYNKATFEKVLETIGVKGHIPDTLSQMKEGVQGMWAGGIPPQEKSEIKQKLLPSLTTIITSLKGIHSVTADLAFNSVESVMTKCPECHSALVEISEGQQLSSDSERCFECGFDYIREHRGLKKLQFNKCGTTGCVRPMSSMFGGICSDCVMPLGADDAKGMDVHFIAALENFNVFPLANYMLESISQDVGSDVDPTNEEGQLLSAVA